MKFDQDANGAPLVSTEAPKSYKFYNDTVEIFFDPGPHTYYKFNKQGVREDIAGVTTVLGKAIDKPFLKVWAVKLAIETLKARMFDATNRLRQFSTEELMTWFKEAKDKHKEELNKAGDIGHLAHNALEKSIQYAIDHTNGVVLERPIVVPDQYQPATPENLTKAQNCADRAFEWMKAHNVRWLHTERKIYSLEYNYSGTLDGDALIDSCSDRFCKGCRGRVFKDRRAITDWKSSNHLSDSYAYQTAAYQFAHIEEFPDLYIPDRWIMRLGKEGGDFEAWYIPSEYFEADFEAFLNALNLYRSLEEIEARRKADKAAFREMVKMVKRAEKEAEEQRVRNEKAVAKEALKQAKVKWDADKKAYYKNLRANGMSTTDAERETEEKFPKSQRPGAKDEAAAEKTTAAPAVSRVADSFIAPAGMRIVRL